jgi:hypothetical protein
VAFYDCLLPITTINAAIAESAENTLDAAPRSGGGRRDQSQTNDS